MQNIEFITDYALAKEGAESDYPFDDVTLVLKVNEKMFMLVSLDKEPPIINLKCDPELAVELRERFEAVTPGWHMNKKHWNTVELDGSVPAKEIYKMIDHSYELVKKKSKKKKN